ncbi:MAG TPA: imidazolonepropionase [Planctomycetia bacterium]|nr:imidazolonepropionase [Planctomycetia bacterium]
MTADTLWTNARVWTAAPSLRDRLLENAAVAAAGDLVCYVGPAAGAPAARRTIDLAGRLVTPGLVDCHTHLVHAGHRAAEWKLRLEGASYEQIARAGGGIASTVRAVRAAGEEDLYRESLPRLDALLAEGVTTVEIKSGYGLDAASEIKMLRVARRLGRERPVAVITTHLGAHALPPGATDKDAYIAEVIERQLPAAHREGLIDAVDAFAESIAFSVEQTRRVFAAAKALGLPIKIHAEQLSNLGGAAMAASEFNALSADHLEYLDEAGVAALAAAGTVAVLLPGAFYFLKESRKPPVDQLRRAGVPLAVATDCNPGSSPLASILLAMNMACTLYGLGPDEALLGVTRNAARALGLQAKIGSLEVGKSCDLAIWNIDNPAELAYRLGANPLHARVWRGNA